MMERISTQHTIHRVPFVQRMRGDSASRIGLPAGYPIRQIESGITNVGRWGERETNEKV